LYSRDGDGNPRIKKDLRQLPAVLTQGYLFDIDKTRMRKFHTQSIAVNDYPPQGRERLHYPQAFEEYISILSQNLVRSIYQHLTPSDYSVLGPYSYTESRSLFHPGQRSTQILKSELVYGVHTPGNLCTPQTSKRPKLQLQPQPR
jgi:hypothetical protein